MIQFLISLLNVGIQIHYRNFHLCPHPWCKLVNSRKVANSFSLGLVSMSHAFSLHFHPLHSPSDISYCIKAITLVSFCLVLATSLIGSCLFRAPLCLEGRDMMPLVHVVSGPIDFANVSSVYTIPPDYNRPKCYPSQPSIVDESNIPQPAILMSDTDFGSIHEISNIPALNQT